MDEGDGEGGDSGDGEGDVVETPPPPRSPSPRGWPRPLGQPHQILTRPPLCRGWHRSLSRLVPKTTGLGIVIWLCSGFSAALCAKLCAGAARERGSGHENQNMGGWMWRRVTGAPLAAVPDSVIAGGLPALNLLRDPRNVGFTTGHYFALLSSGHAWNGCTCGVWVRPACGPHSARTSSPSQPASTTLATSCGMRGTWGRGVRGCW